MTVSRDRRDREDLYDELRKLITDRQFAEADLKSAIAQLVETTSKSFEAERVSVWTLIEPEATGIRCLDMWLRNERQHVSSQELGPADCATYLEALRRDHVLIIDDAMNDPRCIELARTYLPEHGITSMLDCRFHRGGRLAGVLCIEHVGPRRDWNPKEQSFAKSIASLISVAFEVESRRHAEAQLRLSEERFRDFAQISADWFWEIDHDSRITHASGSAAVVGCSDRDIIGCPLSELPGADLSDPVWRELRAVLEERAPFRDFQLSMVGQSRQKRVLRISGKPLLGPEGEFLGFRGTGQDVSDRNAIEAALEESEARYRRAAQLANIGYWVWDEIEGKCSYCSQELASIYGVSVEEFLHRTSSIEGDLQWAHPADRDRYEAVIRKAIEEKTGYEIVTRIIRGDGEVRYIQELAEAVLDDQGTMIQTLGVLRDVTDLKKAEDALRQSQKLEAVGKLTGGVAHDFNNVLAIVSGNLELVLESIKPGTLSNLLEDALSAADRGAKLTHRLLAFSRQQPLMPEVIDAGELLDGMSELLRRTLGEDIDMGFATNDGLWRCEADPHQLENVVLNLAVNARDAMPEGGKLMLEAANADLDEVYVGAHGDLTPGQYVCVSVTDSGCGMSAEVIERAFDPFFTTKKMGKGTGLGLSMAHGFAKQSHGHIKIYSEPGEGTTVKIYLPRTSKDLDPQDIREKRPLAAPSDGELILVVEDDPDLCSLIRRQLQSLGYQVLTAQNGAVALEALRKAPNVDLLLTDVVLPDGMNGRLLAKRANEIRPELPIIYMSGYTENATLHHGRLDEGVVLLQKPFQKPALAKALRECLDRT